MRLRYRHAMWGWGVLLLFPVVVAWTMLVVWIVDGLPWYEAAVLVAPAVVVSTPHAWVALRLRRLRSRDPEFGRLRRVVEKELDRLDGRTLVVGHGAEAVTLRVRGGTVPSVHRLREVELDVADGVVVSDSIMLMPMPPLVLHQVFGTTVRTDVHGHVHVDPVDGTRPGIFRAFVLTLRTGVGIAGAAELRELVDQLAGARPAHVDRDHD